MCGCPRVAWPIIALFGRVRGMAILDAAAEIGEYNLDLDLLTVSPLAPPPSSCSYHHLLSHSCVHILYLSSPFFVVYISSSVQGLFIGFRNAASSKEVCETKSSGLVLWTVDS